MGQIARWGLSLLLGTAAVWHFTLASRILASGNLAIRPTMVTVDDLIAGKYPNGGYMEVTGGFIVPSYSYSENASAIQVAFLLTEKALGTWQARDIGDEASRSPDGLLIWLEPEQLAELWPETRQGVSAINPISLPPLQRTVVGEVRNAFLEPESNTESANEPAKELAQVLLFDTQINGPWNLVERLLFGACTLLWAIKLLRPRNKAPVDAEAALVEINEPARAIS